MGRLRTAKSRLLSDKRTQLATLTGGILGLYSQETDDGNPVFSPAVGTVVGALTGFSMEFSNPTILTRADIKAFAIKYNPKELESAFDEGKTISSHMSMIESIHSDAGTLSEEALGHEFRVQGYESELDDLYNKYNARYGELISALDYGDDGTLSQHPDLLSIDELIQAKEKEVADERIPLNKLINKIEGKMDRVNDESERILAPIRKMAASADPYVSSTIGRMIEKANSGGDTSPYGLAKSIMAEISNLDDKKLGREIVNNISFSIEEPRDAADIRKVGTWEIPGYKEPVKQTILEPSADMKEVLYHIDAAIASNNVPDSKITSTRNAMVKAFKTASSEGKRFGISSDRISILNRTGSNIDYDLTKYNDKGERFIRQGNTMFVSTQANPLGGLMVEGGKFDFSSISGTANDVRQVGASDIIHGFDPVEMIHFGGANHETSRIASSLKQYIDREDIGTDGKLEYRTGLAQTVSKQISLKHTIKPERVSESGKLPDNAFGNNFRQIREMPTPTAEAEMSSIIRSLGVAYPEALTYGSSHTSYKTSIVSPHSPKEHYISPIPNQARSGQGTLNRGFMTGDRKGISGIVSLDSATLVNKKVLSGRETVKALPYILGSFATWGDGSVLFNRDSSQLRMSSYGKLTIAPNASGEFDLRLDRVGGLMQAAKEKDPVKRRKMINDFNLSAMDRAVATNTADTAIKEKNGRKAAFYQRKADNKSPGIPLYAGDTIGYSPTGSRVKLPDYFSKGKVHDVELDADGNLVISYKGIFDSKNENDIKIFSQASKAAGHGVTQSQADMVNFLNYAEGLDALEFRYDSSNKTLLGVHVDMGKIFHNEEGVDFFTPTEMEGYVQKLKNFTNFSGTEEAKAKLQKVLTKTDLFYSMEESGLQDIFNIDQMVKNESDLFSNEIRGSLSKFGIKDALEYIRPGSGDFRGKISGTSIMASFPAQKALLGEEAAVKKAKASLLEEHLFQTYLSEEKIAPDIHSTLVHSMKGGDARLEEIVQNREFVSPDDKTRWEAQNYIRTRIHDVFIGDEVNPFGANSPLMNMKSFVAVEQGSSIHGAGNTARLSYVAIDSLMKSGMSIEALTDIADFDIGSIHELSMIQKSALKSSTNELLDLSRKNITAFQAAIQTNAENRLPSLGRFLDISGIKPEEGYVSYNLRNEVEDLKSVQFSLFDTRRSGMTDVDGEDILKSMDRAKMDIVSRDVALSEAEEGSKIYKKRHAELLKSVERYRHLVSKALTVEGPSNLLNSANSLTGKFSEIRAVKAVGGYVTDVAIPHIKETTGRDFATFTIYDREAQDRIEEKLGLDPDSTFLEEVLPEKGKKNRVWRLMERHSDGSATPALEMITREPAIGSASTLISEILLTNDVNYREESKRSHFVGVPAYMMKNGEREKTIESVFQKQDYDQDTYQVHRISLSDREKKNAFIKQQEKIEAFLAMSYDMTKNTSVKGTEQEVLSIAKIERLHELTGIDREHILNTEITNLGRKGTLRKVITGMATTTSGKITTSLLLAMNADEITPMRAMVSHNLVADMLENILKTQKANTEEVLAPRPKIFDAIHSRENFINNRITEGQYRASLYGALEDYTKLKGGVSDETMKLYKQAIEDVVNSDVKYGVKSEHVASVLSAKQIARMGAYGNDESFFTDVSQAIADVAEGSGQKRTIFNIGGNSPVGIVKPERSEVPVDSIIDSGKNRLNTLKHNIGELFTKKNMVKMGIGASALGITAAAFGRESGGQPSPANLDLGQDASKTISSPTPEPSSTGYISDSSKRKNMTFNGITSSNPNKLEKLIYGDGLVSNRVRDSKNNVSY